MHIVLICKYLLMVLSTNGLQEIRKLALLPPGRVPTTTLAKQTSRADMPLRSRMKPARINREIASNENFVIPV